MSGSGLAAGFEQFVGFHKIVPQTQSAIATGVDFELSNNRRLVGQNDRAFNNRGGLVEFEWNDVAVAGITKRFRLVQLDYFRLGIDLDDEPSEESGAQHPISFAPVALVAGRQRGHTPGFVDRAGKVEGDSLKLARRLFPGNANDGDVAGVLQFQRFGQLATEHADGIAGVEHDRGRPRVIDSGRDQNASAHKLERHRDRIRCRPWHPHLPRAGRAGGGRLDVAVEEVGGGPIAELAARGVGAGHRPGASRQAPAWTRL